jgi:hypothetical protein
MEASMMVPALLFVATLAVPGYDVPNGQNGPATPAAPAVSAPATDTEQTRLQQLEGSRRDTGDRPHTVGFGGQLAVSNRGAGAGVRYFFFERLGLNMDVLWVRHGSRFTSSATPQGSTFAALPSFLFLLKKPDPSADVDVVPYVGGGLSYVSASRSTPTTAGATSTLVRRRGNGGQVFGGIEMTFSDADWMTISAEGIYYKLPINYVNANVVGGFNYLLAFHFYLR